MSRLYSPPEKKNWKGRADALHEKVECLPLSEADRCGGFGLLGFVCDEGIRRNCGRPGAKEGPQALRRALGKLPSPAAPLFDFGDILCDGENLEEAQEALGEAVKKIRAAGALPILLGGGHEIAWGHYWGLPRPLSIVNFDAHFDLRAGKASSGTPFRQIAKSCEENKIPFRYSCLGIQKGGNAAALFKEAEALGVDIVYADDFYLNGGKEAAALIDRLIGRPEPLYLTLCLDVFTAAAAPGVSAPQPLGLLPWHLLPLIRQLAASKKIAGFDVAELSPPYDCDGRTAALAAALILEFINAS